MKTLGFIFASALTAYAANAQGLANADLVKVDGTVSGFTGITTDKMIDAAIVLPSLAPEDLFQFQIDQFIGPSEKMQIGGFFSADVPSNFYIPNQTEFYGIFPVSFNKEHFSIYAVPGDKKELITAWGQLPWDKLMDIHNNHQPMTDILPYLKIKKYGYAEEQDWSSVDSISLKLDRDFGGTISYNWPRGDLSDGDMDAIFLFQGTKTNRWVFANLAGNPADSGKVSSVHGLADNFKMLFMRTQTVDDKIASAQGWVRAAHLGDSVSVSKLPPAIDGKLPSAAKVTWTPINQSGWVSLVIAPNGDSAKTPFPLDGIFGGAFARVPQQTQIWLDPKAGTGQTGLNSNTIEDMSVMLAFIGTTEDVPMPQSGADNSAFINAASEIRMKKLK